MTRHGVASAAGAGGIRKRVSQEPLRAVERARRQAVARGPRGNTLGEACHGPQA